MSIYLQNYLFNLSNLFGSVFPQGFQLRKGQDVTTPDHQHQQGDRILLLHFLSEKENENEGPDYRARTGHDAWIPAGIIGKSWDHWLDPVMSLLAG